MYVLSVSLGSSSRDKIISASIDNTSFTIERRGVDGDFKKFYRTIADADGKVDIITTGGLHHYLTTLTKNIPFRSAKNILKASKKTPVIDGYAYREWAEPYLVKKLIEQGKVSFKQKILFPLATNRLSMIKVLSDAGFEIIFGDLIYDINLLFPIPIRSMSVFNFFSEIIGPFITRLPYSWLYPIGKKQDIVTPKYPRYFEEADIIAGDFHNIRRFMPKTLEHKIIVTNTVTENDRAILKERNLSQLITLSPNFSGRTFGSNVINGLIYLMLKRRNLSWTKENYLQVLQDLQIEPVIEMYG